MTTRLGAENIAVSYGPGGPPVLRQFTLDLRAGEFVGVVGPNGSGKSTLVRALSRVLRPSAGVVLLDGDDLYAATSAREAARAIGTVPQETAVAFEWTVREVVQMGRAPHLSRRPFAAETARDGRAVDEAMRAAGVADLAGRAVTTLSGGERQRVLLARALAQEPQVVLLDEPTAHLDLHHQTQTLGLVRDLAHRDGLAVLAVLHDLNLAAAFCDHLVLLGQGQIVAQGLPAQVLTSENVRRVYGARVWVRCHPASGRPVVLSLPDIPGEAPADAAISGPAVHVLCGGGTGTGLLVALRQQGYDVSAGGLNVGDTDQEAAEMLGIPYAREAPFSALSAATQAEAARLAAPAQVVVLADVPFGRANLATLELALALRRAGKTVLCVQPEGRDFAARDFTGGAAAVLWKELLAAGASVYPTTEDVLSAVAAA